jgi:hypothetical protein
VDVNNAFTESTLEEDIYMSFLPGLTLPRRCVLKLNRSFYGLKQSARQWYRRCTKVLKRKGFVQCISDPCVFIRDNGAIIGVYVDDLIILMPKKQHDMMRDIKKNLKAEFKIKELGNVQKILGIRVTRDRRRRTVYLDQTQYQARLLYAISRIDTVSLQNRYRIVKSILISIQPNLQGHLVPKITPTNRAKDACKQAP